MSQLLKKYLSYLPDHIPKTYPVTILQDKIEHYYGNSIIVQSQRGQGKSNLVFSSNVSVGNVVATAGTLRSKLKVSEIKQEVSTVADSYKDEQILHSAVRILRRDIEKINISTDEYPTANEVSMAVSMERMPLSLTKFIYWLLDKKSFQDAAQPYVAPHDKIRRIMGITECIFSISKDVFTPFYLGLVVQLYHNFGSKQLIETLYSHGFCASYGEVRRYLTSIVHHEMENRHDDVHIPDGIIPIREGGGLIQEGADNIDINTETIDGKKHISFNGKDRVSNSPLHC